MRGKLTAYLQLIRLPNVLTAAADSLAGWLLVGGSLAHLGRWLLLIAASMVLYASGTALNDVFDLRIDRAERPGRPLPSGRASARIAAWSGGLGLWLGPGLALAGGGVQTALVATALAIVILAYDAGMKHTPVGPAFMGACRGLNLLMGMAVAPALGGVIAWCGALGYGLYVAGITIISRFETREGDRRGLVAGVTVLNLSLMALVAVALAHDRFPSPTSGRPLIPLEGILVFALIALAVNQAAAAAIRQPGPRSIQKTVKIGILSLVWINVALVAAVRGIEPAAVVAAFWVPAYVLGRWLYST